MRVNGTIQLLTTAPSGENEFGEPIPATSTWSDPVPASINANSDTRKGKYEDGNFRQASYVVLLEEQPLPTNLRRIRLERHGEDLGEHDVLNIVPLTTVGRIQITV